MTDPSDDRRPAQDQGGPDAGPQSDRPQIVVSDPEDFARTRQLRSVFDARDGYQEGKHEAKNNRDLTWAEMNHQVWNLIQRFAFAIEPLAKQHDAADRFWTKKKYKVDNFAFRRDKATLEEGLEFLAKNHPRKFQAFKKKKNEQGKRDEKTGLMTGTSKRQISNMETVFRWRATPTPAEFEGIRSMMDKKPMLICFKTGPVKKIKETAPPIKLSDKIYRDLNNFIDQIGLGFDVETTQQTKIDDDLLDEVETWRKNNI